MKKVLVILGATGDLTFRYLVPALADLFEAGKLPDEFSILGVAREDWDVHSFRTHILEKLEALPSVAGSSAAILKKFDYRCADISNKDELLQVLREVRQPAVFYLALPPRLFALIANALAELDLSAENAVVIEKPFGEDLLSARALNQLLHDTLTEKMVFRIDSFLGEQTVHNIMGMRFGNRIFEPLWTCQHIERVEIIWEETLTVEGRALFYDHVGALKDMIQNHLLQLLCIVAMEPPRTLSERDFRDRRLDVLRAVRSLTEEEIRLWTARGRYGKGRIGDRTIAAYADQVGVDPSRGTETYAAATLWIDNWRWAGVPFTLRTGKALAADRMEIAVHFKPIPHHPFNFDEALQPNILRLKLNPDHIGLAINISGPCESCTLENVELEKALTEQDLSAYARLLLHVMEGKQTLFIRDDEAEESWRIVEPIIQGWSRNTVQLLEYPAGSAGLG